MPAILPLSGDRQTFLVGQSCRGGGSGGARGRSLARAKAPPRRSIAFKLVAGAMARRVRLGVFFLACLYSHSGSANAWASLPGALAALTRDIRVRALTLKGLGVCPLRCHPTRCADIGLE